MDGDKCILQLRGVRTFLSNKYDITRHKRYKELADANKKNEVDVEKYLNYNLIFSKDTEFEMFRINVTEDEIRQEAQGKIWVCKVPDEEKAREVERKYRITSKQYVEGGLQLRVISEIQPELECMSVPATLEDAYIYFTNRYNK